VGRRTHVCKSSCKYFFHDLHEISDVLGGTTHAQQCATNSKYTVSIYLWDFINMVSPSRINKKLSHVICATSNAQKNQRCYMWNRLTSKGKSKYCWIMQGNNSIPKEAKQPLSLYRETFMLVIHTLVIPTQKHPMFYKNGQSTWDGWKETSYLTKKVVEISSFLSVF